MSEKCVVCGNDIPEGRQVCPECEEANKNDLDNVDIFTICRDHGVMSTIDYDDKIDAYKLNLVKQDYRNKVVISDYDLLHVDKQIIFERIRKAIYDLDERIARDERFERYK